jgi:uncharacterized protein (TIGR04222 family)
MDLFSWIAHMRGPEFLALYSIYSVLVIAVAVVWSRRLDPAPASTAFPTRPTAGSDPYEIAWLREGITGVLTTALFSLRRRGLVSLGELRVTRTGEPAEPLDRVERTVFDSVGVSRTLSDLRSNGIAAAQLAPAISAYESKFLHAGLLTSPGERGRARTAIVAGLAAVLGLGAFKLAAALSTGHTNVVFLIMIALFASSVIAVACWPKRLNSRGRAFVKALAVTYGAFEMRAANAAAADAMLPLYVAVLGTSVLAGTEYADFHQAHRQFAGASGGGGADAGGGCSGGGSSCGGGGGCGGGGCGGCGGG